MDITELRQEIDGIDDKLLELFQRRMAIVKEIGLYKKEKGLQVSDPDRESNVLRRLCEKAPTELAGYVKSLFTLLMEMSRDYQGV